LHSYFAFPGAPLLFSVLLVFVALLVFVFK
jgi:hypothetical protein